MISQFFTSYNCIDFVKDSMKDISTKLLNDIREFISENKNINDLNNFLTVLESEILAKPDNEKKFSYKEVNYGYESHGALNIMKNLYLINLYEITVAYLTNPKIEDLLNQNYTTNEPHMLKSFFDGSFYKSIAKSKIKVLYLAIYADEINLINPIGNSCS